MDNGGKWYKATGWNFCNPTIEVVYAIKASDKFLTIASQLYGTFRVAKVSESERYFKTFDEAKEFIVHAIDTKIHGFVASIRRARDARANAATMECP